MIINTNISALNNYRQMGINQGAGAKAMEKLSSGLRINRAGDDAAGLAISEKMRAQVRGLDQASRNSQDGISMIQTTEGALQETHNILQRMRELATQSANDTNADVDRQEIQKEMNQLSSEINRIGNTTEFNTKKLLNGEANVTPAKAASVQGTQVGDTVKITNSATAGVTTGKVAASDSGVVSFHAGKNPSLTGTADVSGGVTTTAADNELTVTLNGTTKTVTIAAQLYADGDTLASAIQTALNDVGAFGTNAFSVKTNNDGQIVFEAGNKTDEFSIDGGNLNSHLVTAADPANYTSGAEEVRNDTLTLNIDGRERTVTLTNVLGNSGTSTTVNGTYDLSDSTDQSDFLAQLQADIDAEFGAGVVTASFETIGGKEHLKFESGTTGSKSSVTVVGGAGNALDQLGIAAANQVNGLDVNNSVKVKVDGEEISFTLSNGDWNGHNLANKLQEEINSRSTTASDVSVTFKDGQFSITNSQTGKEHSVEIITDTAASAAFAKAAGLGEGATATAGKDKEANNLLFQIGANAGQFISVDISDMRANALGVTSTVAGSTATVKDSQGKDITAHFKAISEVTDGTNNENTEFALDISSAEKASAAIKVINNAIESVSGERSKLGAFQNRLEHTISNLNNASENLQAAESRIRDVDMAKEVMEMTRANILGQASQAMLAQANQKPQAVLQLLG